MRARKTTGLAIVVVLGLGLMTVAFGFACSGGPGTLAFGNSYENHPGTYESPGPGREPPGTTNEVAPKSVDPPPSPTENPGTQGGGPAGTGGGGGLCAPCDKTFDCAIASDQGGGKPDHQTVHLVTRDGKCESTDKNPVEFDCGGKLVVQGQDVGTWSSSGPDNVSFTATVTSTTTTNGGPDAGGTTTTSTETITGTCTVAPDKGDGGTQVQPVDASVPVLDGG